MGDGSSVSDIRGTLPRGTRAVNGVSTLHFQVGVLGSYIKSVQIVGFILTVVAGYLLGSIPTGFLLARARGIDIRTVGSGNIGATNVLRSLGRPAGVLVLLADFLKGWLAAAVVGQCFASWFGSASDPQTHEWFAICGGLSAILGHNYTCWLYFKGGKGIATSAGVLLALVPWALLIIFCVWVVVFAVSRYVSLASICASVALPFAAWATKASLAMVLVTAGMAALAVGKHGPNIKRLIHGTEHRLGSKKVPSQHLPGRPA